MCDVISPVSVHRLSDELTAASVETLRRLLRQVPRLKIG